MISRQEILALYRQILKYGIHYPSKNRAELLASVSQFFHESKKITDSQEISERHKMARMVHANFKMYYHKTLEIKSSNTITPLGGEPLNMPKDKDFLYF